MNNVICLHAPFRAKASISFEAKNISSRMFTPVISLGLALDHRKMSSPMVPAPARGLPTVTDSAEEKKMFPSTLLRSLAGSEN